MATDELDYLRDCGAEMMLEIARFWSSIAHFNPKRERWEIHGVMGPDEFHEGYPGRDVGGLRNNAYTNMSWRPGSARPPGRSSSSFRRAGAGLRAQMGLTDDEIRAWEQISRRMFVPFHGDGIISQFEGYEDLEELNWDEYRERYGNLRAPRPDPAGRGQQPQPVAKQPDTLMLFFLFPDDELGRMFEHFGTNVQQHPPVPSSTTTAERPTARRSASTVAYHLRPRRHRPGAGGSASGSPSATSTTSRAAQRRKASTRG